jgi:hypothetical protein
LHKRNFVKDLPYSAECSANVSQMCRYGGARRKYRRLEIAKISSGGITPQITPQLFARRVEERSVCVNSMIYFLRSHYSHWINSVYDSDVNCLLENTGVII